MDQLQYLDKNGHLHTDNLITWGLATCHNVSQSDLGFVGNQVEVKMFAVTGWNLIEAGGQPTRVAHPVDPKQQLTIVRVNEFEHARRSMSVIALDESTGDLHVFCKVRVTLCIVVWMVNCGVLQIVALHHANLDPVI